MRKNSSIRNLNLYSKSYLNHLIKTNEILASMLISLHNINFYQQFMLEIRKEIKKGTFNNFYNKYIIYLINRKFFCLNSLCFIYKTNFL